MSQASVTTGLPKPKNYDSMHASVLGDGLYTQEKVKPLEEYLLQQVGGSRRKEGREGVWGGRTCGCFKPAAFCCYCDVKQLRLSFFLHRSVCPSLGLVLLPQASLPPPKHHPPTHTHIPHPITASLFSHQVAEGSYDFEANKTLLKLYLLYPPLANQEKVETVRLSPCMRERRKRG